jgi:hypothetical protein
VNLTPLNAAGNVVWLHRQCAPFGRGDQTGMTGDSKEASICWAGRRRGRGEALRQGNARDLSITIIGLVSIVRKRYGTTLESGDGRDLALLDANGALQAWSERAVAPIGGPIRGQIR